MLKKSLFYLALIFLVSARSPIAPYCPDHYTWTNMGCIQSCSSPTFNNCKGKVFITIYDPSFCAIDNNGNWQSFTFACQACNQNYIAVKDGKCGCDVQPCQQGYKCVNNQCVIDSACGPNQIETDMGCVKSCSSPQFSQCPNIFPLIYDPSFCAIDNNGNWQSFTFECQACQQNYAGVKDGKCGCDVQPCQQGYKCVNNQCIANNTCGPYQISTSSGCILSCDTPELRSCPDVINTLVYDPQYCGLKSTGAWVSYTHICQACNSGGIGVKQGKCSCEELGCRSDQICSKGYCQDFQKPECTNNYQCPVGFFCNGNKCVDKCIVTLCQVGYSCIRGQCIKKSQCPCQPGYKCINNTQCIRQDACDYCQNYEICFNNNQCIDKCAVTLCPQDTECIRGQCVAKKQCSRNSQCKSYEFCLSGVCTDRCAYIRCQQGYICKFGGCIPDDECSKDDQCAQGFTCHNGKCVDKCAGVRCNLGYICKEGNCVSESICDDVCSFGQICRNGNCVDPCIFTTCPVGTYCRDGQCLNSCDVFSCGTGFVCKDGKCIKDPNLCLSSDDCGVGKYCYYGKCYDKCQNVQCPQGFKCVLGICQAQIQFCPAQNYGPKIQYCTSPRPNNRTCPNVVYIREPDPAYCGVLADGTRKNFYRQCQACKDTDIVYYLDAPCHEVPFVCNKGEQCLDYYCGNQFCRSANDCPYDWQTCFNNKCVDRCSLLRCANCKFGQCAYQQPYGSCYSDANCQNGWQCIGSKCVDQCLKKRCPAGYVCKLGECVQH